MESGIPIRYRPFVVPVVSILAVFLIGVVGGRYIVTRIFDIRRQVESTGKEVEILEGRAAVLRNYSGQVASFQKEVLDAIPLTNPSLLVSAQIKSLAAENNLEVADLKSSVGSLEPGKEGLSELAVRFTVIGDSEAISFFIDEVSRSTPLTKFRSVGLSSVNKNNVGEMELVAYWAPLPSELPPLTQPIESLSKEELALLQEISSYTKPVINDSPEVFEPVERGDPFSI